MNFGRAVLKGLAIGAKGWESEREEGKKLVQQLALVRLQQRANMMAEERQRQFDIQKTILQSKLQIQQEEAKAKAEAVAKEAYYNSDRGRAEVEYWESRVAREKAETRQVQKEMKNEQTDGDKRTWKELEYLDKRLDGLQENYSDELGSKGRRIIPGKEEEYKLFERQRNERRRMLGFDVEMPAAPAAPSPFTIEEPAMKRWPFLPAAGEEGGERSGRAANAGGFQGNADPLGLR